AFGHQWRGDAVGQVGDELRRRRIERAQVEGQRIAKVDVDVLTSGERIAKARLQRPVELDGMDGCDAVGEIGRQDAKPGADLEYHVGRVELGESPDHRENVLVGEEVLPELPLRPRAQRALGIGGTSRFPRTPSPAPLSLTGGFAAGSAKAEVAFASIRAASSGASSPRTSASAATVYTTCAGSFGRPRIWSAAGDWPSRW